MQLDTQNQLSRISIVLHWAVAILMIGLLAVGVYMSETETGSLYYWHKSFGVTIFFIVILRVAWRVKNGWPTAVGKYSILERILARLTHWVLIVGTILLPISGFLMSSIGGHGVKVFGFELVARNINPEDTSNVLAYNEFLAWLSHEMHHWLGYIIIAAVALHILGALKHHFIDKDDSLKRML